MAHQRRVSITSKMKTAQIKRTTSKMKTSSKMKMNPIMKMNPKIKKNLKIKMPSLEKTNRNMKSINLFQLAF